MGAGPDAQSESHSWQGELWIIGGNVCVGFHGIRHYAPPFTFQSICQLDAMRIIDIDNGCLGSRTETAIDKTLLRVPIVLHRLVIIEMIAREIRKYCDFIIKFITP